MPFASWGCAFLALTSAGFPDALFTDGDESRDVLTKMETEGAVLWTNACDLSIRIAAASNLACVLEMDVPHSYLLLPPFLSRTGFLTLTWPVILISEGRSSAYTPCVRDIATRYPIATRTPTASM